MACAVRGIAPQGAILGAFNIKYVPRTTVMGQVLADLVAEITESLANEMAEAQHMDGKLVGMVSLHKTLCPDEYMLMALQIKGEGDPQWGQFQHFQKVCKQNLRRAQVLGPDLMGKLTL